jgi:DNA-binding NtrC family response regulator
MTNSSLKILVVDDDPNITRALWRRFRAVGIEVIQSHHAKEGMVLAMTEHPNVIITDYKMPGISGEQFLMNLKYNSMTKNIPVIMVTGVTFDGKEDYALKRQVLGRGGAVSFLNKPLDFDSLLKELRQYIKLPT